MQFDRRVVAIAMLIACDAMLLAALTNAREGGVRFRRSTEAEVPIKVTPGDVPKRIVPDASWELPVAIAKSAPPEDVWLPGPRACLSRMANCEQAEVPRWVAALVLHGSSAIASIARTLESAAAPDGGRDYGPRPSYGLPPWLFAYPNLRVALWEALRRIGQPDATRVLEADVCRVLTGQCSEPIIDSLVQAALSSEHPPVRAAAREFCMTELRRGDVDRLAIVVPIVAHRMSDDPDCMDLMAQLMSRPSVLDAPLHKGVEPIALAMLGTDHRGAVPAIVALLDRVPTAVDSCARFSVMDGLTSALAALGGIDRMLKLAEDERLPGDFRIELALSASTLEADSMGPGSPTGGQEWPSAACLSQIRAVLSGLRSELTDASARLLADLEAGREADGTKGGTGR